MIRGIALRIKYLRGCKHPAPTTWEMGMEQPDQTVECGLERALTVIKGKWKPTIIWLRASIPQPQPALPQPGVVRVSAGVRQKERIA